MKRFLPLLFVVLFSLLCFGQGFTMNTTGPDETSAVLLNQFGQLLQIGIPYESGLGNLSENLNKPCKFQPDGVRGSVQVCTSLGITYVHANSVAWPFFNKKEQGMDYDGTCIDANGALARMQVSPDDGYALTYTAECYLTGVMTQAGVQYSYTVRLQMHTWPQTLYGVATPGPGDLTIIVGGYNGPLQQVVDEALAHATVLPNWITVQW